MTRHTTITTSRLPACEAFAAIIQRRHRRRRFGRSGRRGASASRPAWSSNLHTQTCAIFRRHTKLRSPEPNFAHEFRVAAPRLMMQKRSVQQKQPTFWAFSSSERRTAHPIPPPHRQGMPLLRQRQTFRVVLQRQNVFGLRQGKTSKFCWALHRRSGAGIPSTLSTPRRSRTTTSHEPTTPKTHTNTNTDRPQGGTAYLENPRLTRTAKSRVCR